MLSLCLPRDVDHLLIEEKCRDPLGMTLLYSIPSRGIWVGGGIFILPQLTFQQEIMKVTEKYEEKRFPGISLLIFWK